MADGKRKHVHFDPDSYREYARKMDAFVYGPTTTYFEQLVAAGIELPTPDALSDADLQKKLWEVIAGLADLLVFLNLTDHLTDRELYTALWTTHLHQETPVSNEVGFRTHMDIVSACDEDHGYLYFKHYASDEFRESWLEDDIELHPDFVMPPHEDPPYTRDYILPCTEDTLEPKAREWLQANPSATAFARNRFQTTQDAAAFVDQLYAAGAKDVVIANITLSPPDWLPYADTLYVSAPDDREQRQKLRDLIDNAAKPDENDEWRDKARKPVIRLRWIDRDSI